CDTVMDKMDYPRGLIRYTSGNAIKEGLSQQQVRKRMLRPRTLIYTGILTAVFVAFMVSLATRTTLRVDVIRDRGALGREVPGGMIENVYRLQIINTAEQPLTLSLSASGVPELSVTTADNSTSTVQIEPTSNRLVPIVVRVPVGTVDPGLHEIEFHAHARSEEGRDVEVVERSSFYVPN